MISAGSHLSFNFSLPPSSLSLSLSRFLLPLSHFHSVSSSSSSGSSSLVWGSLAAGQEDTSQTQPPHTTTKKQKNKKTKKPKNCPSNMFAVRIAACLSLLAGFSLQVDVKSGKEAGKAGNFMEDEQWLSTISQYSRKIKHWNRFRDVSGVFLCVLFCFVVLPARVVVAVGALTSEVLDVCGGDGARRFWRSGDFLSFFFFFCAQWTERRHTRSTSSLCGRKTLEMIKHCASWHD